METKKKALFIRVTEEEKQLFVREARKVSRSLSNFIIHVVKEYLQRKKEE